MSKRQILMIVGIWIIVLPFLGFPKTWDVILTILSGILIIGIAYSMRPVVKSDSAANVPFVEHKSEPQINNSEQKPIQ